MRRITRHDVFAKALGLQLKNAPSGCGCDSGAPPPGQSTAKAAEKLARDFERICERAALPAGAPLPQEFAPFVKFAADQLGIRSWELPPIRVVSPSALRDGATGMYDADRQLVFVAAGLSDEETRFVVAHELAHHYSRAKKGWVTDDEAFAYGQEARIIDEWRNR